MNKHFWTLTASIFDFVHKLKQGNDGDLHHIPKTHDLLVLMQVDLPEWFVSVQLFFFQKLLGPFSININDEIVKFYTSTDDF